MTAGETLLKVTDYPFAYSFVVILGGILGFSITQNKLYLLGIAGTFGTFLSIIDPIGRYVRYRLEKRIRKIKKESETDPDFVHKKSAIGSKAIGIEIDQLVGLLYFAFILVLFVIGMALPMSVLADNFVIVNKQHETVCNSFCIRGSSMVGSLVVAVILSEVGRKKWSELDKKIKTAGMHQIAIENEYATQNSVENMTRAIEQGDWVSADRWGNKIKEEIWHKKGKRDLIIKGIEKVCRPLHKESNTIEHKCNQVATGMAYPSLEIKEWQMIVLESNFVFLEDKELLQRIGQFYTTIQEYDYLLGVCSSQAEKIILKRASEEYGKDIRQIGYYTDKGGGDLNFLKESAILCIHPNERFKGMPKEVKYTFFTNDGKMESYITPPSELQKFEPMWTKIIEDVEKDTQIIKMKQSFNKIQNENTELKQKYLEKIAEEVNL